MYLVRETFTAQPGHAGPLAEMMKKEMEKIPGFKGKILLDFVTNYNTIVCEYEIESMAEFEKSMVDYKKDQKKAKKSNKPPKYTQMYQTGKREIFKIV